MNDNIEIRSLEGLRREALADAFLDAFADYNISFSREQLYDMLRRRGFEASLSFGAFDAGRLVSFVFNGIGQYRGVMSAYDTGTGTVKAYRGLGLTDRIFTASLPYLREAGVKAYRLEVLTDNHPAVKIYIRQGFSIDRELNCYSAVSDRIGHAETTFRIAGITADRITELERMNDFAPTWQNSIESLQRAGEAMSIVGVFDGDKIIGYGAAEVAYGDIAAIAVDRDYRHRGIGRALLSWMARKSEIGQVRVVNVEATSTEMNEFLLSEGFGLTCRQYEMSLALDTSLDKD